MSWERDLHWSNREHPHIDYSTGHCGYRYSDGARCVWEGRLLDGMCAEHRWLTKQAEQVRARQEKQKAMREKPVDHTTPWHCGLSGCKKCAGKPSHRAYWNARGVG